MRFLRNKKISDEASEINSFATKRPIEKLYRSFKEDNIGFKNVSSVSKCDPQKFKECFLDHFSIKEKLPTPSELINVPKFMKKVQRASPIDINIEPPDNEELKNILKRLKSWKSANDVPTAFLKCALDSEEILDELNQLYR